MRTKGGRECLGVRTRGGRECQGVRPGGREGELGWGGGGGYTDTVINFFIPFTFL